MVVTISRTKALTFNVVVGTLSVFGFVVGVLGLLEFLGGFK